MGLVAALSNPATSVLYERLTAQDWHRVHREPRVRTDRSREGKLKYGTVSSVVLAVLREADGPLRMSEIHSQVEARLQMPISKSTVKEFLSVHAKTGQPRVRRINCGVYELG